MRTYALLIIASLSLGILIGGLLHSLATPDTYMSNVETPRTINVSAPKGTAAPANHISEKDISVLADSVVINVPDAVWARFTPTGSMVPVFDENANAIEIVPTRPDQIQVGDIISYQADWMETPIIHRVVAIGNDSDGWYATTKGDNNNTNDPGKIRFSQVRRLVVAIIY